MGCLKLTYDHEPHFFLQGQEEKIDTAGLQVWVNRNATFEGVEIKVLTQGDGLTFADLWANYGSGLSHLHPKTKEELFPNYCAINLSESLIKNGLSPGGTKCWGNCSSNQSHTIRAQELADWLQGNLSGVKNITGKDFMSQISGKTGIVFFQNYYEGEEGSMTGDHIDLWNKNQMGTYGPTQTWIRTNISWLGQLMGMSDLRNSTQILFWEIK